MSRIEKLIEELCPEGVEFKKLGEVAHYSKSRISASVVDERNYVGVENLLQNKQGKTLSNYVPIKGNLIEFKTNDILIGNIRPYLKKIWMATNNGGTNGDVLVIRINSIFNSSLIPKFLYFALSSDIFFDYDNQFAKGGKMPRGDKNAVLRYNIPIPPLPIQQEIVTILDTFTELDAELQAELETRRKQYEHYRNELLNFEGKEVEWKTLGEIGKFIRGNGLQKKDFTDSGVGCIHYGQLYTYYGTLAYNTKSFVKPSFAKKLRKAQKGNLVIATTSENVEDVCKAVAWLGEEDIAVSGDAYIFKHNQNPKYIAYYYKTQLFFDQKKKCATGTKVIRVSGDNMAKFKIPIPPLAEQERIVGILDKFEALVTGELPAEIAARRKQYEYYREKLLTLEPLTINPLSL